MKEVTVYSVTKRIEFVYDYQDYISMPYCDQGMAVPLARGQVLAPRNMEVRYKDCKIRYLYEVRHGVCREGLVAYDPSFKEVFLPAIMEEEIAEEYRSMKSRCDAQEKKLERKDAEIIKLEKEVASYKNATFFTKLKRLLPVRKQVAK